MEYITLRSLHKIDSFCCFFDAGARTKISNLLGLLVNFGRSSYKLFRSRRCFFQSLIFLSKLVDPVLIIINEH